MLSLGVANLEKGAPFLICKALRSDLQKLEKMVNTPTQKVEVRGLTKVSTGQASGEQLTSPPTSLSCVALRSTLSLR